MIEFNILWSLNLGLFRHTYICERMGDCQCHVKSSSYACLDWEIPENIQTLPWAAWTHPPVLGNSKILYPPYHLNFKIINPSPLRNFWFFVFRSIGITFWLYKTLNKWENCTFSTTKIILINHNFQSSKQATPVCYKCFIKYRLAYLSKCYR